jgi:hypothetical protein
MKTRIVTIAMLVLFTTNLVAQTFDLSAEIRPRYENKHGYKTLQPTDADGSNFISQRTRLNFGFKNETLKAYVSFQNIRVWGDVSTLSSDDNATALHEAWADVRLAKNLSLKLGRQEIVYDDHRIFGSVGWAQQARSHDAFIFKFKPNKSNRLDVGFALNSDSQAGSDNLYSNAAGYKAFQYAWYHGNFNKVGLSFLLLNSGKEYLDGTDQTVDYMQTVGPRVTYKSGKLSANAATYFQAGKQLGTDVSALYYTVNLGYKVSSEFKVALGYEYLSGKDQDDADAKIKSFAPLFGTNHKFNGWMDYFYVGNHGGSVGLTDINATFVYHKGKFSAKLIPHLFSAASDVYNGSGDKMDSALGTEIDLTLGYKVSKAVKISGGYSQMLATDTMEVIKIGDKDEHNSWAWIMFTIKPKLFSHTIKK